jgi:hypothetical protein
MRYLLTITLTIGFLITKAQFCSTVSLVNMGVITPTTSMQSVAANAAAKRYWRFSGVAGCTYTLSTCTSTNTNDTYLRLYSGTTPSTAVLVASNDDYGPICATTKASIVWTCGVSTNYSILFTNYSCANISSNSYLTFRRTCPVSLPIELASFEGYFKKDYNDITWVTETELNNDYFNLDRSIDGLDWETIAIVKGAGTSNLPNFYSYKDYTFCKAINYYRLTQIDFDGSSEQHKIIYVNNSINSPSILKVTNILGIDVDSNYRGLVLYYYSDGKVIKAIQ